MDIHDELAAISLRLDVAIGSALENEVADSVKAKMQDVLDCEVYSYDASSYFMGTRRYDNGGLRDTANMISKVENFDTLFVENIAPSQSLWGAHTPIDLPTMVEEGWPDYADGSGQIAMGGYRGAHAFHADTERQAVESGAVEIALRSGLKRQGF